ncbi:MAG TPA: GDP-mannose 4,6-dehydratase [Candidatus Limnocylindria bacterium]|nr:GDP-mannose 4,6-dehydratase [Candidatus Limnocylindria bacterium]
MRIFITGATGFVGRWLALELREAGHEVLPASAENAHSQVDVTEPQALFTALRAATPDAVAHLAAVSSASDAARDPEKTFGVAVGGTVNLLETLRELDRVPAVLVVSSSEVYGRPKPEELPLTEDSPLRPGTTYSLSKVAQESVALAYAARLHLPLVVTRSFNHIGPGQRPVFVVPALAERVLAVKRGEATDIPVGNVDVRRDFTDVRDVVRAYRLLLEGLAGGSIERGGRAFNVASGKAVSIRHIVELLADAAGVEPIIRVDPSLVREDDAEEIKGDAAKLRAACGWQPEHSLSETLEAVWQYAEESTTRQGMEH